MGKSLIQTKKSLQPQGSLIPVFTKATYTPFEANQGTQLSLMVKEQGQDYVVSVIALQMNTALKIYDSLIDPSAIAITASLIVDEFKLLKMEEILLAFKRGASLRYGKIFGKLSLPVFFEWIRAYIAEVNGEHGELAHVREKAMHNKKIEDRKNVVNLISKYAQAGNLKVPDPNIRYGKMRSIKDLLTFVKQVSHE